MTGIVSESAKHSRPRPKQAAIIDDIRSQIIAGKLSPGVQLPTVASMQKLYGASDTTVQSAMRYLREQGFIQPRKRNGMFVAKTPPHLSHFGIVLPYYDYQSQYIVALKKEAQRLSGTRSADGIQRRFSFFSDIDHPEEQVRQQSKLISAIRERFLGGMILVTGHTICRDIEQHKLDIPCVTMFTAPSRTFVNITHALIIERALDILKEQGRKSVALLTGERECKQVSGKFAAMARQRGIATHTRWIHGIQPQGASWAETCAQLLMNDREPPDALIIGDDNLVPYATAGIGASGVKVPDDLMVAAHANFPYPTRCEVPAIRIGTDVRRLMKTAVETIEAMRRGENVPHEIFMQPCLEREAAVHS